MSVPHAPKPGHFEKVGSAKTTGHLKKTIVSVETDKPGATTANVAFSKSVGELSPALQARFRITLEEESRGDVGKLDISQPAKRPEPKQTRGRINTGASVAGIKNRLAQTISAGSQKPISNTGTGTGTTRGRVANLSGIFSRKNTKPVGVGGTNLAGRGTGMKAIGPKPRPQLAGVFQQPPPKSPNNLAKQTEVPEPAKLGSGTGNTSVKQPVPLPNDVKQALAALNSATAAHSHNTPNANKKQAIETATNTAAAVANAPKSPNVLPTSPHTSSNAARLAALTSQLNLATQNNRQKQTGQNTTRPKEVGNQPTTTAENIRMLAAKAKLQQEQFPFRNLNPNIFSGLPKPIETKPAPQKPAENINMTVAHKNKKNRRGLPPGLNLGSYIPEIRREEGLSPAPGIFNKKTLRSLGRLGQESSTNVPEPLKPAPEISPKKSLLELEGESSTNIPAPAKPALAPPEEPSIKPSTKSTPELPKPGELALIPSNKLPTTPTPELVPKPAPAPALAPINTATLAKLAEESGFFRSPEEGPNIVGFASTFAPKKVGKKTKNKIIRNTLKQKKLEKKLRNAASGEPGFFKKLLTIGLGLGHFEDPRQKELLIDELKSKIQKLDNNISKGEARLDRKRAVAQNESTKKNLNAKQKAINRTRTYRDLLGEYMRELSSDEIGEARINNSGVPKRTNLNSTATKAEASNLALVRKPTPTNTNV